MTANLTNAFYLVGEDRDLIERQPFRTREEAVERGTELGVRFAILEVLEEFNNYAWGE